MRTRRSHLLCTIIISLLAMAPSAFTAHAVDTRIRLNTVGFLPEHDKRASIAAPCSEFSVNDEASGKAVFRGKTLGPVHNADTGEDLYVADFSVLRRPGLYHLEAAGVGRSAVFRISNEVYNFAFYTAVRAMTLWRCGTAVRGTHAATVYAHGACHLEDAWLDAVGGGHTRRDATGGWHDAGDYNKYVVNSGVTVGTMLLAWEQFGDRIRRVALDLPDKNTGLPDYLSEIKWELDWLLKMQTLDGSVYHKVSTREFGPAIPPEQEKTERFITPYSSAATADFVAMTAMAARVYEPFDKAYARRCLEAARRGYAFLQAHAENHPADLTGFRTGAYQTKDDDDRLWAAAEMWETTGETICLADIEARGAGKKFDANWGWSNVSNLGLLTYLFSKRSGRRTTLVSEIKAALLVTADEIVRARDAHGYARPLTLYYWGCNGGVANTTVVLQSAYRLTPKPAYTEATLDALGHLFGRNFYGRSFVTGLGASPPLHPHDRRSMGASNAPTWPGYLVGGGWPRATDWKDEAARYDLNEIAINWNAPLIYALAGFVSEPTKRQPR
ncbi:MAG TPA: glycoside hydrolase family 9 protein [Blastocatellia bacterium]|nr:glycoside hydrolase family 9 protein [Blastocatellia bacterium]